jgi:hypothetical protein
MKLLPRRREQSRFKPAFNPSFDRMEARRLLSFADGNGPVVISLTEQNVANRGVVTVGFDGPLNPQTGDNLANYAVNRLGATNPELITTSGPAIKVLGATYQSSTQQVLLTLAKPLAAGVTYRVFINGSPGGLTDINGVMFDGDNDDTPSGNFYGLLSSGQKLKFTDSAGDRVTMRLTGGGQIQAWRELDGDLDGLTLVGTNPGVSTLTGSVIPAKGSTGQVYTPAIAGSTGVNNQLDPQVFVSQVAVAASPAPIVATAQNLPYTLQIQAVNLPSVPAIQSAVYAQSGGLWLLFGGRTNGLHDFTPSGTANFPPEYQNNNIYVINPTTGQTWTMPWSATGLAASVTTSLSSANQDFHQAGNLLYTAGGYSDDPTTGIFTTYSTLTSLNVKGLIKAVMQGGRVGALAQVRQMTSPKVQVTGGEMEMIGNRAYLVFGQDFEGGYNGNDADFVQIYSDEIRSFRILNKGAQSLAIANYQALRDPVNFRRRDYNLGNIVKPGGQPGLLAYGGVFTPSGNGYRYPIFINSKGQTKVDYNYQQYFSQYTSANVPLYDAANRTNYTIFLGGISLYDYDFSTGQLTSDPELPFVDDVTTFALSANNSAQEFMMPSQLPGRYGTEAAFFATPGLPKFANGVIKLSKLQHPTVLGDMYGGIFSTVGDTTDTSSQTTDSNQIFQVTLVPTT